MLVWLQAKALTASALRPPSDESLRGAGRRIVSRNCALDRHSFATHSTPDALFVALAFAAAHLAALWGTVHLAEMSVLLSF